MKYLAYLILLIVGAGEMRAAVSSPIINSNQVYQLITNYAGSGSGPTNGFTGAQVTNSFTGLSALDGVATGTNQTIVFFIGDSMTANYAVNDVIPAAQNWSQYLPYFSGWSNKATYVNLSVPGISEVTVSNNWSTVYLPVINQYTNRNRIVVFSLGHNGNANGLTPAQQTNTFAALYTKARAAGAKAVAAPYTGSFFLNLPNKTNANIGIRLLYTNNVADYLIDFTVADNYLVEPTTPTHPSAFGSWLIASNANFNITIPASPIRIPLAQTFSGGATFIAPLGGAALTAKGSVIGTGIELVAEGTNGYGKSLPFWYARTSHVYRSVSEYVGPASYLYNKDAAGNDVSASGIGAAGVLDAPTIGWYFHRIIGSTNGFVVAGAGGATAFGVDGSGGIHHKGSVYNYSPNYFTDGSSNNTAAIGVGGSVASGAGPGSVSHRIIGTTNSYAVADNGGTRVLIVDGDTNGVTITRDLRPQAVKFDLGGVTYGALGLGGSVVAGNGDADFGFRVTGTNRFSIGAGTGGTRAITVDSNSYVTINMPGTGDYVARDGSGNLFATNSGAAALTNVVNTFTGNSNIFNGPIYVGGVVVGGGASGSALVTEFLQTSSARIPMTWLSNNWGTAANNLSPFVQKSGPLANLFMTITNAGTTSVGDVVGSLPTSLFPKLDVSGGLWNSAGQYDPVSVPAFRPGFVSVNTNGEFASLTAQLDSGFLSTTFPYPVEDYFEVGTNSLNSSNATLVMFPKPYPSQHNLMLFTHGYTGDELGAFKWREAQQVFRALLTNGYTIAFSGGQPSNWGNRWGVNEASNTMVWFTNRFPTTNISILSGSMGGLSSLNWMAQNPRITRWYGIYPCINLGYTYSNSVFTSVIEGAYNFSGGANFATATSGFDPYRDITTNTFAGRRFRMTASPGDTAINSTNNSYLFATKHTNTAFVKVFPATGEHGDASHFSVTNVISFFNEP